MSIAHLDKKKYSTELNWFDFFASNLSLDDIPYNPTWIILFSVLKKDSKYKNLNEYLKEKVNQNKNIKIYPKPMFVFKAFSVTQANTLSVVILGQDPYFNCEYIGSTYVPQATGLSFSIPSGCKIPSSLDNIFANLVKFGHIKQKPTDGNLWSWALQGCLMLNATLTVEDGSKQSHLHLWDWFTSTIITYISNNYDHIIFVLWGRDAYEKASIIDKKHTLIVSSHPSGLSASKPFKTFPAFMDCDHFGKINESLIAHKKMPIIW